MGIEKAFTGFGAWLRGWPDGALTLTMLVLAGVIVYIALRGTALEKAITTAWVLFP